MPEYRRSIIEGGIFFFTVDTYNRLPILTSSEARKLLRAAWENVRDRFPFVIDAVCLLPEGDADYSKRSGEIKRLFTKGYLGQIGAGEIRNEWRQRRGEAASGMAMVEFSPVCEEGILRAGMGRSGWGGGEEDGLW